MLDMVERGIRGGMCGLGGLNYKKIEDPEKECILPLDANNLYGHTMTFDLPIGKFEWVDDVSDLNELIENEILFLKLI